ncbi:MAG TPA: geranylgeranylglycerol-phosphate geranylgeranyltransferase [Candidatus Obscuribacterales bacterium]
MISISSPHSLGGVHLAQAFARLFRLPVGILAALAGCASIYVLDATAPLRAYLLTAFMLVCMTSAACAINDYWDLDKDRIDHPERPLPSGDLSLSQAWWAAIILFSCALIAALGAGILPFILVLTSTVLLWNYSHLLLYNGILGNLIVAVVVSALVLLGSLVIHQPFTMLYPAGFLFCYALAKEIIWDIHDAEGDRSQGIITIANSWGDRVAFAIAWGLLSFLLGSVPIALYLLPMAHPWLFTVFSLILLVSLEAALARYQQQRNSAAYQGFIFWERLGMLCGIIALLETAPAV